MTGEYYDHTTYPSNGAHGSSSAMRSELKKIEAGFDKLPTLTGNATKLVRINAAGTAQEASNVVLTNPATGATLTLADNGSLITVGAFALTLTATAAANVTLPTTGTLATLDGVETLTNKTLTTPALGTPASGTLTNCTGLPVASGISDLGTGVATALAVNVGSDGAPVVFNGALGTPSSGTVTNLTGTASININGTVGATTPASGAFTTLSASGAFVASSAVPHAIGGAANTQMLLYVNGSFSGSSGAYGVYVAPTLAPAVGGNSSGIVASGTFTKAASGTHADFNSMYVSAPVISGGAATVTNATSLKVSAAPTGGTNNRALWVASGTTLLGGGCDVTGAISATNTQAATSSFTFTNASAGVGAYTQVIAAGDAGSCIMGYSGSGNVATGLYEQDYAYLLGNVTTAGLNIGAAVGAISLYAGGTGAANKIATVSSTGVAVTGAISCTGNTTLGDASTDTVTVNGYMGVGGAGTSTSAILVTNSALTGNTQVALNSQVVANSSATVGVWGVFSAVKTAAAAFTCNQGISFYAPDATKGAGSTITNLYGVYVADQTQGTSNYGISSLVSSGANKWNIYASGTANNAFAGNVRIGGTTAPTVALDVTGAISATTTILSSGATSGIGYTTGAGGTVTQATSKSTGVTLNKVSGRITMNNASLAAGTSVQFTLTNSAVAATDTISHSFLGSSASSNSYTLTTMTGAGVVYFELRNHTAGAIAEAVQIQFNVIKGAVS